MTLLVALAVALWIAARARPAPPRAPQPIAQPDSLATPAPTPAAMRPPAPRRALVPPRPLPTIEERARRRERVAITATAYCLQGRTRRGNLVREGIVAADPRLFPLGSTIEVWIGRRSLGEFLVDDTGKDIKGGRLDVWLPDCGAARRFGRRRGYAQRLR